jgi:hypothetical protein
MSLCVTAVPRQDGLPRSGMKFQFFSFTFFHRRLLLLLLLLLFFFFYFFYFFFFFFFFFSAAVTRYILQ